MILINISKRKIYNDAIINNNEKTKFNNLILTVSNFVLFIQYHF